MDDIVVVANGNRRLNTDAETCLLKPKTINPEDVGNSFFRKGDNNLQKLQHTQTKKTKLKMKCFA
jgi:hypothetical protein